MAFSSVIVTAQEIIGATTTLHSTSLSVTWQTPNRNWYAEVEQDFYLGSAIPLLHVAVTTGNESEIELKPNCYYRGTLTQQDGTVIPDTVVFIDLCNSDIIFRGFVAENTTMYRIVPDENSVIGISMNVETTSDSINPSNDTNSQKGWGSSGSGGALRPSSLYSRNVSNDEFPSVDIYVDPTYVNQVGESDYFGRIIESLALANTIYAQSDLNQLHLAAVVLLDKEFNTSDSQGNILHRLSKLRQYTAQADSADTSLILSGGKLICAISGDGQKLVTLANYNMPLQKIEN